MIFGFGNLNVLSCLSLFSRPNCPLTDEVMNTKFVLVIVTVANKQEAEKIAQNLLNEKLIACANIINPVISHFHWSEKIDVAEECLVLMKSRMDLFSALAKRVAELHSYEVPEVLALPIIAGAKSYLDWIDSSVKK